MCRDFWVRLESNVEAIGLRSVATRAVAGSWAIDVGMHSPLCAATRDSDSVQRRASSAPLCSGKKCKRALDHDSSTFGASWDCVDTPLARTDAPDFRHYMQALW